MTSPTNYSFPRREGPHKSNQARVRMNMTSSLALDGDERDSISQFCRLPSVCKPTNSRDWCLSNCPGVLPSSSDKSSYSPSKGKKIHHAADNHKNYCLWKRSSPSRRHRTNGQQQLHPYHRQKQQLLIWKWQQRSILVAICLFTFTMGLGWRMLILHTDLVMTIKRHDQTYQKRILASFLTPHTTAGPHQPSRRKNLFYGHSRRQRTQPPKLDPSNAARYMQTPEYELRVESTAGGGNKYYGDTNVERSLNARSRVLLVGVLSSSWGVPLALHLHNQYGVSRILGTDAMLPNRAQYRLLLLKRYEYLAQQLTNFQLWAPFTGFQLNQPQHDSGGKSVPEYDFQHLLRRFQPTHIVYLTPTVTLDRVLGSYKLEIDEDAEFPNFNASTSTMKLPWNVTARLFDLRHRVQSLNHFLQAFASYCRRSPQNDPSSERMIPRVVVASTSPASSILPQHHKLDQLLVNSFSSSNARISPALHQIIVPPLYGNWLDDHDPLHQLSRKVLQRSIFPDPRNSSNSDMTNCSVTEMIHSEDEPFLETSYLHVDDLLPIVARLLQTSPRERQAQKMQRNRISTTISADTIGTSIRQAIQKTIVEPNFWRYNTDRRGEGHTGTIDLTDTRSINSNSSQSMMSAIQQQDGRIRELLAWKYAQDFFLRDPAKSTVANNISSSPNSAVSSSEWISTLPVSDHLPSPFANLPCACECAYRRQCCGISTAFDQSVIFATQKATEGAKFAVYTVNFDPTLTALAPIRLFGNDTELDEAAIAAITSTTSRVAFVSAKSPLVQRYISSTSEPTSQNVSSNSWSSHKNASMSSHIGEVEDNGWKLVWLASDRLSIADRLFPKIAPGQLFSDSVDKAMYVAPHKIERAPILPALTFLMHHIVDAKAQKRSKGTPVSLNINSRHLQGTKNQDGAAPTSVRWVYQPPARARRSVLFAQEHNFMSTTSVRKVAQMLWNVTHCRRQRRHCRQIHFYDHFRLLMAQRSNSDSTTPDPFQWIDTDILVHNINLSMARSMRCDWLVEHLTWHHQKKKDVTNEKPWASGDFYHYRDGMEELSLAYIVGKYRLEGRLGNPLDEEGFWSPFFDVSKGDTSLVDEPPRLVNNAGQEIFLRVLSRPLDEASPQEEKQEDDENPG